MSAPRRHSKDVTKLRAIQYKEIELTELPKKKDAVEEQQTDKHKKLEETEECDGVEKKQTDKHTKLEETEECDGVETSADKEGIRDNVEEMVTIPIETQDKTTEKSSSLTSQQQDHMSMKTKAALMFMGSVFVLVIGAAIVILVIIFTSTPSEESAS